MLSFSFIGKSLKLSLLLMRTIKLIAELIVNYTSDVTNIDNIIATKSSNSNVIKGNLVS